MLTDRDDPINHDYSDYLVCHHCREVIEPETEIEWDGWEWCVGCVPSHVLHGQERELREAERANK